MELIEGVLQDNNYPLGDKTIGELAKQFYDEKHEFVLAQRGKGEFPTGTRKLFEQ